MARYLLLLLWLVGGTALAQHEHRAAGGLESPDSSATPAARFAKEMDAGMTQMVRDMHASGYSGDADVDFLAMMIPHHQGAIEMARLVLIHGRDPLTRKLAEEIIAGQSVEIEGMTRRLSILRKQSDPEPDSSFPALGGTRGVAR